MNLSKGLVCHPEKETHHGKIVNDECEGCGFAVCENCEDKDSQGNIMHYPCAMVETEFDV